MLNQRLAVTRDVTIQLTDLERDLDAIIVKQARLQIALIEGRRSANLPLDTGQRSIEKIMEAAANLVAARAAVHFAHYDLRAVRDQLRLPVHAYGDYGDTPLVPEPNGQTGASPDLAIVREAA